MCQVTDLCTVLVNFREHLFRDRPKSPGRVHSIVLRTIEKAVLGPFRALYTGQSMIGTLLATLFGRSHTKFTARMQSIVGQLVSALVSGWCQTILLLPKRHTKYLQNREKAIRYTL